MLYDKLSGKSLLGFLKLFKFQLGSAGFTGKMSNVVQSALSNVVGGLKDIRKRRIKNGVDQSFREALRVLFLQDIVEAI